MYFDDEDNLGVSPDDNRAAETEAFEQQPEPQYQPQPQYQAQPEPRQEWHRPEPPVWQQPITPVTPPPGVHYAYPQAPRKRGGARRVVAAVLVFTVLLGVVGVFSAFYEITPTDDGFSVMRRGTQTDSPTYNAPPTGNENEGSNALQAQGAKDGPSLVINPAQTSNTDMPLTGELTMQQVAAKCTPAAVGIVAMSESYYYGQASSTGTGVIMSSDGYIITNNHVIDGASSIVVTLYDGREYEATLIGKDSRSDLAVLKINATGLTAAEFGDSDAMVVGDSVVAIGNPLGLSFMGTVTDGIVSAINRDVVIEERSMTLLQTNAAINSGNSGGPLFNMYGQVIGIINSKMQSYSTTVEGLGFAIPTNTVKEIVDELILNGYIKGWPSIGIEPADVTDRMSQYYSIPRGVLVNYVHPQSNAYLAGLQTNDIIVEANGQTVEGSDDLSRIKESFKAGESFTIKVYRYSTKTYHEITFALNDEAELPATDSARLIP